MPSDAGNATLILNISSRPHCHCSRKRKGVYGITQTDDSITEGPPHFDYYTRFHVIVPAKERECISDFLLPKVAEGPRKKKILLNSSNLSSRKWRNFCLIEKGQTSPYKGCLIFELLQVYSIFNTKPCCLINNEKIKKNSFKEGCTAR